MRHSNSKKIEDQAKHLKKYLENATNCSERSSDVLGHKLSHFITDFKRKWMECNRTTERFLVKNEEWLKTSISFPRFSSTSDQREKKTGRPAMEFTECSERTKRKKTEILRSSSSPHELSYAAQMSLRSTGQTDAAKLVKEVMFSTPTRASRYRKAFNLHRSPMSQLSGEEALSMIVEAKLTRHQYNIVRSKSKQRFPSYKLVQATKKQLSRENRYNYYYYFG